MPTFAVLDEAAITLAPPLTAPAYVTLSNGNTLQYWNDYTTVNFGVGGGTTGSLRAQLYDPQGTAIGSEFWVNGRAVGGAKGAVVVALADGGFAAGWTSDGTISADSSGSHVSLRIFDASGAPQSLEFVANGVTAGSQSLFDVLALEGGTVAALYRDQSSGLSLRARIFDSSGNAVGSDVVIGGPEAGRFYNDAQALGNGGFMVTWSEIVSGKYDVRAQVFDATGAAAGSAFTVNQAAGRHESFSTITPLTDGRMLVQWKSEANFNNVGVDTITFGRVLNANGAPAGNEFILSQRAYDDAKVTAMADGGFITAWVVREYDNPNGATGSNLDFGYFQWIAAQRFDANGVATGPEFQWEVTGHAADSAISHSIAIADIHEIAPGRLAVSWTDTEFTAAPGGASSVTGNTSQIRFIDFAAANSAPEITWYGGGENVNLQLAEDVAGTAGPFIYEHDFGRVSASDLNGAPLAFSLSGEDAALFTLDPVSGRLILNQRVDFDNPDDLNQDNTYRVTVTVSDGTASDVQNFTLTVTNIIDGVVLAGGSRADKLAGSDADDTINGSGGNDTLSGLSGIDWILGGDGNDSLIGGGGADILEGGAGNDTYGLAENRDTLIEAANGGTDLVTSIENWVLGSNFENLVLLGTAAVTGTGNAAANDLKGNAAENHLQGLGGNDKLAGLGGNDLIEGGDGNDKIDGGTGADAMSGGHGNDTYIVDNIGDTVSEAGGSGKDSVSASVSFVLGDAVEKLTLTGNADLAGSGNALANTLTGNAGDNVLLGYAGKDSLTGGDGDDWLDGGASADKLRGGNGADTFALANLGTKSDCDTILDFVQGVDRVAIDRAALASFAADAAGSLSAANFALGAASTADHHLVYNAGTGVLYYDTDGVGGTAAVQIAQFSGLPGLSAGDFVLV